MGGCFSAKFLRELGGKELDIHIWNKKESTIGGRAATVEVGGRSYEAGAAIGHNSNHYLLEAVKEHGEDTWQNTDTYVRVGLLTTRTVNVTIYFSRNNARTF